MKRSSTSSELDAAAIRLREAAFRFARLDEPTDDHDSAGQRANRALLKAAERYAVAKKTRTQKESHAKLDRR